MSDHLLGTGKWVFVDWLGVEPGYGTRWSGESGHGFCVPQGVELKTHLPAFDLANPAIVSDRPWENHHLSPYATFMADEGRLRCWYETGWNKGEGGMAYAESDNGIDWKKPELGIVEFDGSKKNNLTDLKCHGGGIFKDPTAPADERYKVASCHWTENERCVIGAVSADGLHWRKLDKPILPNQHADTQNVADYDPELKKYVLYTRQVHSSTGRRGINRAESDDFRHFEPSVPVLENNPHDPVDWDYYCNSYSRWPGAQRAHLMRISMYERISDGMSVHLATSRDGKIWHRPLGRRPWLGGDERYGEPLTMYATNGIIPSRPGEWSTYTFCEPYGHNTGVTRKASEQSICRSYLREDGFMSISSVGAGRFWTLPFELTSDSVSVNVDTLYAGYLRCAIVDAGESTTGGSVEAGNAIDGFDLCDCDGLSGDHVDGKLSWKGKSDLRSLRGRMVRLQFELYRADLYAIKF